VQLLHWLQVISRVQLVWQLQVDLVEVALMIRQEFFLQV